MQSNNTTTETPKLKIVGTITETKPVEKDIDLPYYFKNKYGNVCKVVTTEHYVRVINSELPLICLGIVEYSKEEIASGTPIKEFEFEAAYQKATMYIDLIMKNEPVLNEEDENVQIDEILSNRQNPAA